MLWNLQVLASEKGELLKTRHPHGERQRIFQEKRQRPTSKIRQSLPLASLESRGLQNPKPKTENGFGVEISSLMSEFLDFLYSLRDRGSSYGLQRMQEFTRLLGNPQNSFPSIHVAGTNGKGSVCSMLSAIYRNNGYKVGMFTSPHLVELGERVQVNGEILSID